MQAAQEAGYLGDSDKVPFEVILDQMANHYGCLPHEVLDAPADDTMRVWRVARHYDSFRAKRPKFIDRKD